MTASANGARRFAARAVIGALLSLAATGCRRGGGKPGGAGGAGGAVDIYHPVSSASPPRPQPADAGCDAAGTFTGVSSCCGERLCTGYCGRGGAGECECATGHEKPGGCPAPTVCCERECVGATSPLCLPKAEQSLSLYPKPVDEGDTCGRGGINQYGGAGTRSLMCCNGELCHGQCVLYAGATKPVCECMGNPGGCPAPTVCCGMGGCVPPVSCNLQDELVGERGASVRPPRLLSLTPACPAPPAKAPPASSARADNSSRTAA
jgi:hypothetical protein